MVVWVVRWFAAEAGFRCDAVEEFNMIGTVVACVVRQQPNSVPAFFGIDVLREAQNTGDRNGPAELLLI